MGHPLQRTAPPLLPFEILCWSRTHGWDLSGVAPSSVAPEAMSHFLRRREPWDFGGAGTEQGFLFYLLYIKHRGRGVFGASTPGSPLPLTRHFCALPEHYWIECGWFQLAHRPLHRCTRAHTHTSWRPGHGEVRSEACGIASRATAQGPESSRG